MIPGNFHRGDGELVQLTEGTALDAFAEACRQTAWLMFPSLAPSDALAKLGEDRAIPRGVLETDASYRNRLRAWRFPRGHRIRGNATGLLEQIAAVFGNDVDDLRTIDARGTEYTWGDDGAFTVARGETWDWDGEALTPNWGRFWVTLKVPGTSQRTWAEAEAAGTTWAEAEAAGYSWASYQIHAGLLAAIKRLCTPGRRSWTPAGRRAVYCVVWFEGETYPAPDGTWDDWANRPQSQHAFFPLNAAIP